MGSDRLMEYRSLAEQEFANVVALLQQANRQLDAGPLKTRITEKLKEIWDAQK
jgi:hypothetical protein